MIKKNRIIPYGTLFSYVAQALLDYLQISLVIVFGLWHLIYVDMLYHSWCIILCLTLDIVIVI